MSARALETATLAQLRLPIASGGLGYTRLQADFVGPDGRAPEQSPDLFVGVHGMSKKATGTTCQNEEFALILTVSLRVKAFAYSEIGPQLIEPALTGINDVADAIVAMMVNQMYTIMNAANVIINAATGGPFDGFCEPLFDVTAQGAFLVGGEQWNMENPIGPKGLTKDIVCTGARRIQVIGNVA